MNPENQLGQTRRREPRFWKVEVEEKNASNVRHHAHLRQEKHFGVLELTSISLRLGESSYRTGKSKYCFLNR